MSRTALYRDEILILRDRGLSVPEIAAQVGLATTTVYHNLRVAGRPAGRALGSRRARPSGPRLPRRRDARRRAVKILRLYRYGNDVPEIARRTGLSRTTISRYLHSMGVPRILDAKRYVLVSELPRAPYWALRVKRGAAEVVLGRKFCSTCGRWRHLVDFPAHQGGISAACGSCRTRAHRLYDRRATPEQRALTLEYSRIWKEAQRRKAGVPQRQKRRSALEHGSYHLLPAAPLVAEMLAWHDRQDDDNDQDHSWKRLAEIAGVDERAITRIHTGESKRVSLRLADHIAVALGIPLSLLYPYDDEEVAA